MSAVGIPRALLTYHYLPTWRAFFEALDIEVVVSPQTTGETVTRGAARVVSETCLPVALTRAGRSILPSTDMLLEAGDVVDVSTTAKGIAELRNCLMGKEA